MAEYRTEPSAGASLGRYFPWHVSLARHPKARKLARGLGVSKPTALGHLSLLWAWAMEFAADGDLTKYDADDLAVAAEWEGDPERFVNALVSAGFVDDDGDGLLSVHDWDQYGGRLEAQRRKNAERQADFRQKRKEEQSRTPPTPPTSPHGSNGYAPVTSPLDNALEERRGEESTVEDLTVENLTKEERTEHTPYPTVDAGAPAREDAPAGAGDVCARESSSLASFDDGGRCG